tara:strand:- start:440 stop:679 length:240 start_codon:yes stop_codon:yes gene_type:complete
MVCDVGKFIEPMPELTAIFLCFESQALLLSLAQHFLFLLSQLFLEFLSLNFAFLFKPFLDSNSGYFRIFWTQIIFIEFQ